MAQGQFWQWKRKNLKTGKEEIHLVQGALRPSVLGAWEYVFPEECLVDVLSVMKLGEDSIGVEPTVKSKAKLVVLRKLFGAQKIPKEIFEKAAKKDPSIMITQSTRGLSSLAVPGVSIHPIGIKADARQDCPWGYNQELL